MQRSDLLLFRLLLVGGLLAAAAVAGSGLPPRSCDAFQLALEIDTLYNRDDNITTADRAGASCAVVRSSVDSSIAATGDVTPCLCLLDNYGWFHLTALCIEDVPDEIYAPCGGQRVKQARLLAARCQEIIHPPPPSPSPSPSGKEKHGGIPRVDAISADH